MIVKCEQCQTRFKIPDDKVTEKGVKVRCTKCQHTFRVKKEGDSTAPAVGAIPDPFAKFGPATPAPEPSEETRPHMFIAGVQATKSGDVSALSPSFEAQADLPREAFESPTRVGPLPSAPPGRKPLADPAPFDFSALGPPTHVAPPAARPSAFEPQPFDFSALAPPPGPPATDVTQRAAMPGPPQKPSMFEPQPFDFSGLAPPPDPAPTDVTAKPRPPQKPSSFEPQPFDFSSLGSEPPPTHAPPAPIKPVPATSAFEPQPFDFSSLEAGGPPPPPPPMPAQRQPPAPPRPPPSAPKRSAPPPAPAAPPAEAVPAFNLGPALELGPAPALESPPPPPDALPSQGGGLLADVPPDTGSLSIEVDGGLEASPESRGALFEMPAGAEPTENQLSPAQPQEQVAVAKIQLKKVSAEQLAKPTAGETSSAARKAKRGVVAMVWNVLSGTALLALVAVLVAVVLNEGKVDAVLSWSKLKSLFTTPRELVAFDISNGLYDTRAGRPVFYVRGEVKNRGSSAGRVKVKAEILDGEDLVRAAEGWVGATPSPEELYAVATADDLTKLAARLAPSAVRLQPGAEGSFLVTFYEYPPDLKDFRVRVTVAPDDGTTAAR